MSCVRNVASKIKGASLGIFSPFSHRQLLLPPSPSSLAKSLCGQVAEAPPARLGRGSDPTPTPPPLFTAAAEPRTSVVGGSFRLTKGRINLGDWAGVRRQVQWSVVAFCRHPPPPARLWIRTLRRWRKAGDRQTAAEAPCRPRFARGLWEHPWR